MASQDFKEKVRKSAKSEVELDLWTGCGRLLSTMKIKSYKPEVLVNGKWAGNALRFASPEEAFGSVMALRMRWWVPEDGRVTESEDPVNYRFVDGRDVRIEA